MDDVTLSPGLDQYAEEAMATGRSRAMAAGLSLLRRREQARAGFVASLEATEAEAEREGWHDFDDVLAEAEQIIAAKRSAA